MRNFSFDKFQKHLNVKFIKQIDREYWTLSFSDGKTISGKENVYLYDITIQIDLSDVEIMNKQKLADLIRSRGVSELEYLIDTCIVVPLPEQELEEE